MDKVVNLLDRVQTRLASMSQNSCGPEISYKCNECQDRGFVLVNNDTAKICRCQEQKRLEKLFSSSQITPAFKHKNFDNFSIVGRPVVIKSMLNCAKDFASRFKYLQETENNWLVLLGEPGCGKTHLIMAAANEILKQGIPALYFQHVEGMNELKDSFRKQDEGRITEKLNELKKVPVLIWDDLFKGREKPTDWVLEVIFEVLNYRYLNLLPTMISSERLPNQLLEIDRAIGSRIIQRGKGHMVAASGVDANYRLNGGA